MNRSAVKVEFDLQRVKMVEEQIMTRGIKNPSTLAAMKLVPRHEFVPLSLRHYSYADGPLPIGEGQTISQPYIVALMTEAAELDEHSRILEIGTGSGYAAAVASRIVQEVYTIERIQTLSDEAKETYLKLGYTNIFCKVADGTLGWGEHAPFDAIIVTAGAPFVPESYAPQLKVGGRLIIPVGRSDSQQLVRLRKTASGGYEKEFLEYVRFVPLLGQEGW